PGFQCLAIVNELLCRSEDISDPHVPLLLWWAIESKAVSDRELIEKWFVLLPDARIQPMLERHILDRLARRYMAEGTDESYAACAHLLAYGPNVDVVIGGFDKALEGRNLPEIPAELRRPLTGLWQQQSSNPALLRLMLRLNQPDAFQ